MRCGCCCMAVAAALLGRRLVGFGDWHHERRAVSVRHFRTVPPAQQLAGDAQRTKERVHPRPPFRCFSLRRWQQQHQWRRRPWAAVRRSRSTRRGMREGGTLNAVVLVRRGWNALLRCQPCPHVLHACAPMCARVVVRSMRLSCGL